MEKLRLTGSYLSNKLKQTGRWYYEENDEDMFELGKYISEISDIPFEFVMANDFTSL